ncbi:MAG: hypothetical protein ACI4TE_08905 [Alphaproteobacteria bacterium]
MSEESRIYNFGNYVTSSEEIAEIFFYLKQMETQCAFSPDETADSLVEKQMAVSGYVSRIKASLKQFMKNAYQSDPDRAAEESCAGQAVAILDEMKKITFYFREAALQLPAEKIKDNLYRAAGLAARLPVMVAALDAGEDEAK